MASKRVVVISPDSQVSASVAKVLKGLVSSFEQARDAGEGLKLLKQAPADTVVIDARSIDLSFPKLARKILEKSPLADIVLAFDATSPVSQEELLLSGADETIEIPPDPEELAFKLRNLWQAKENLAACGLAGKSKALKSVAERILQIAPTDISVLITGESGTGKELAARAIHKNSSRRDRPFLAFNCGAFAEGVLESELFGHEKGSFTGAIAKKLGVFEAASGGTIFLDEAGELQPSTQVKLLRVLEEREIMRVGGTERIQVDARVVAATNRDLSAGVAAGMFRADLYYRLAVVKIELPSLRERTQDIPILVYEFLNQLKEKSKGKNAGITDSALETTMRYHWPGNVRELKNFIESSLALSRTGRIDLPEVMNYIEKQSQTNRQLPVVTGKSASQAEHDLIFQALTGLRSEIVSLKTLIQGEIESARGADAGGVPGVSGADGEESLENLEKEHIRRVLEQVEGNRRKASRILGIGERTLYRKLKAYGLK